ncbi:hypothetical protein KAJ87_02890 [Candidatus Pacearchaeota archaeon]|nr:hypothetical protein [Candidatus Pacearchaeota archaeon]
MFDWEKTKFMKKRLIDKIAVKNGTDYYQGRFVINRDSLVDGGVYLGQGSREAIVVDFRRSKKLKELYEIAKIKATENGKIKKQNILQAVYNSVEEAMPKQSEVFVKNLINKYGLGQDKKIALDVFLDNKIGVCRHDALTCTLLLELFKKEKFIKGESNINRNSAKFGGHAWCRYKNSDCEIFILDVAKKYIGRLENAPKKVRWCYERPDDF